ncbi:hypothetical protein LXL04_032317 [Taraxacum kok-saghyz]
MYCLGLELRLPAGKKSPTNAPAKGRNPDLHTMRHINPVPLPSRTGVVEVDEHLPKTPKLDGRLLYHSTTCDIDPLKKGSMRTFLNQGTNPSRYMHNDLRPEKKFAR